MTIIDQLDFTEFEALGARREVAVAVLQLLNDNDSGAGDIARIAGSDPLLSAKIMRMANSAYYGLSGKVKDLNFAVSVLGFLTVRSLSVATLLNKLTPVSKEAWKRYAAAAATAHELAPYFKVDPSVALCSGMLMDLGELYLAKHDPRGYSALFREVSGLPPKERDDRMVSSERELYGMDHAGISARMLKIWNFPNDLCDAIAVHHGPPIDQFPLGTVLYWSALISPYAALGLEKWDESVVLAPELDGLNLEELLASLTEFVESFTEIF